MGKMRKWLDGVASGYLSLWRRLTGWRLFLFYAVHYTLLFAVLQRIIFAPFIAAGKGFTWEVDGVGQHYARLIYIHQVWQESVRDLLAGKGWHLPLYDFRSGPALVDTQVGLAQLLAILWPSDNLDGFYNLYALSNYYWMGITFSAFGFYWKQKPLPVLTGAISYAFCAMAFFAGVRHPHFMTPMVVLPLLLIGAEKVVRGERAFVFSLAVFLSLATQWGIYFSWMQAVFVTIYLVVRFFDVTATDRPRQALRLIGRLAVWGGVAVLLSAMSWLPALIHIMGTGRVANAYTVLDNMLTYDTAFYYRFLEYFLINPASDDWRILGFPALTLPALVALFVRHRKSERSLRYIVVTLVVMLLIPAVAYFMSGFSNVNSRFCFGFSFCMAAVLMFMLPRLLELTVKERILTGACLAAYCAAFVFIGLRLGELDARPLVFLLVAVALMGILRATRAGRRLTMLAALAITCCSVCYTAFWLYDVSENGYVYQFPVSAAQELSRGQYASMADSHVVAGDESFFRVAGDSIMDSEGNYAFRYNLNGLTMYPYYGWSGAYVQWASEMEIPRYENKHHLNGHTTNAPLLTLDNVKYYASRDSAAMPRPYGFVEVDSVENAGEKDVILQNLYALPIGYAYEQYMTRETYDALNALGKQEAQLSAVLLEEAPALSNLPVAAPQPTAKQISYEIKADGVAWDDGLLLVEKNGGTLTLVFEGLPRTQTYLRIVDHVSLNGDTWTLEASTSDASITPLFYNDGYVYAHHQHTQTLDFGFHEEGLTQITITFPFEAFWRLADLQVWCQPMDDYAAQIDALADEALQNVVTDWHSLKGDITVGGDRMLAVAIPYTDGWTAYVDGEKTKLYQANTGFMAVELTEGTHAVELRYMLPGLRVGLAMSAAGIAGLAALLVFCRRKEKGAKL